MRSSWTIRRSTTSIRTSSTFCLRCRRSRKKDSHLTSPFKAGTRLVQPFSKRPGKHSQPHAEINSGRFHTAQAFLYTPAAPAIEQTCAGPVTVGLVGLHIVQKTQDFPMWLWATFEQVDTTPADPANPGANPPEGWGFFK